MHAESKDGDEGDFVTVMVQLISLLDDQEKGSGEKLLDAIEDKDRSGEKLLSQASQASQA